MTEQPVALITGGNRGLGREAARQLAAQGYHVLLGSRDLEAGRAIASELSGKVEAVELDVRSSEQTARLRGVVERLGRLDALVNNAGITGSSGYRTSILDLDLGDLEHVLDVNVAGALRVASAVVP